MLDFLLYVFQYVKGSFTPATVNPLNLYKLPMDRNINYIFFFK